MRKRRKKKRSKKSKSVLPLLILLLLLLIIVFVYAVQNPAVIEKITNIASKNQEPAATIPVVTGLPGNTVKLAAFNIQVFGTSKAGNSGVMEVLSKTIKNFDIVAVQEIRDASQTALPALKDTVNSQGELQYDFVVSERLGRTASKEQYAYLYNTATIELIGVPYTYPACRQRCVPQRAVCGKFQS